MSDDCVLHSITIFFSTVSVLIRKCFNGLSSVLIGGLHALLSLLRWEHAWWQLRCSERSPSTLPVAQVHSTTPPTGAGMGTTPLDQATAATAEGVAGDRVDVTVGGSGSMTSAEASLALRRYICVALTNLTFGAPTNKAFVCKRRSHLEALIAQLEVGSEELKQASPCEVFNVPLPALRNLRFIKKKAHGIVLRHRHNQNVAA